MQIDSEQGKPGLQTPMLEQALHRILRSLIFRGGPDPRLAELPLMQLRCLRSIASHEGDRMHDLHDRLDVKMPALSQIIERLVRRGMVVRQPDPEDRRAVRIYLTDIARGILRDEDDTRHRRMEAVMERLDSADSGRAIAALEQLASAAEAAEREGEVPESAPNSQRYPLEQTVRSHTNPLKPATKVSPEPVHSGLNSR